MRAAYNWVPFPGKVLSSLRSGEEDEFDGWIDVEVTAETPLFVRAGGLPGSGSADANAALWQEHDERTRNPRNEVRGQCEFFNHGDPDMPWLPGSELRGLVRSMFTILSDGALRTDPGRTVVTRRGPARHTPSQLAHKGESPMDAASRVFGPHLGFGSGDEVSEGALRFEDLASVGPVEFVGYKTTKAPMLAPQPASFLTYLRQPTDPAQPHLTWDDSPDLTRVRGFKLYPHAPDRWSDALADPAEFEVGHAGRRLRTVMRPVKRGTNFGGRIWFTGLCTAELGGLIVSLDLGPAMRHRLGLGKALGLGSLRVDVRRVVAIDWDMRAKKLCNDGPGTGIGRGSLDIDVNEARAGFLRKMVEHRSAEGPDHLKTVALEDLHRRYWEDERMCELYSILDWATLITLADLTAPNPNDVTRRQALPPASSLKRRPTLS